MVDCLSCSEDGSKELSITDLKYNKYLQHGDPSQIIVKCKMKTWFGSYYGRICLFESGVLLAESGSVKFTGGQETTLWFSPVMLNRDMHFTVSLQLEAMGWIEYCQDGRNFIIQLSDISAPPTNPDEIYIDTDGKSPTIWNLITGSDDDNNDDDDDESLRDYLLGDIIDEDTVLLIVLGVAVILIVLAVRK